MLVSKLLRIKVCLLALGSTLTFALRAEANNATVGPQPSPNIIGVAFVGVVAAVQATAADDDTRIYFQNPDNSIEEFAISGPFNSGVRYGAGVLVPASQVRAVTPIAAVSVNSGTFQEIRVYFFSPQNILSEYIYDAANGATWRGGPSCTDCLTTKQIVMWPSSQVLYALTDGVTGPTTNTRVRVGFVSAPNTLSEMIWTPLAGWQSAQLN